jgi:hypothetical protein
VSRTLPRSRWSCFFLKPETLLRWHRRLVAGAWTYPHRQTGRPPLDQGIREPIIRLARENPTGAIAPGWVGHRIGKGEDDLMTVNNHNPRARTIGPSCAGHREEDRGGAQVAARESLEELSRELQVEAHRLAAWRDDFLAAGK